MRHNGPWDFVNQNVLPDFGLGMFLSSHAGPRRVHTAMKGGNWFTSKEIRLIASGIPGVEASEGLRRMRELAPWYNIVGPVAVVDPASKVDTGMTKYRIVLLTRQQVKAQIQQRKVKPPTGVSLDTIRPHLEHIFQAVEKLRSLVS